MKFTRIADIDAAFLVGMAAGKAEAAMARGDLTEATRQLDAAEALVNKGFPLDEGDDGNRLREAIAGSRGRVARLEALKARVVAGYPETVAAGKVVRELVDHLPPRFATRDGGLAPGAVAEVARRAGVNRATVARWLRDGAPREALAVALVRVAAA